MLVVGLVCEKLNQVFLTNKLNFCFENCITESSQPLIQQRVISDNQIIPYNEIPERFQMTKFKSFTSCGYEVANQLYTLFNVIGMDEAVERGLVT